MLTPWASKDGRGDKSLLVIDWPWRVLDSGVGSVADGSGDDGHSRDSGS